MTHIAAKTVKKTMRSHRGVSAVNLVNSSMSGLCLLLFFASKSTPFSIKDVLQKCKWCCRNTNFGQLGVTIFKINTPLGRFFDENS